MEGFKYEHFPKIELFRKGHNQIPLAESDADIIAVATDTQCDINDKIPCLDLNNTEQILQFIIQHFSLKTIDL